MKRKLVFAIALFIVLTSGNFVSQKNDCTNKNTSVSAAESTGVYKGIKYTSTGNEITITGYTDDINPKKIVIPDYIDDLPVTSVNGYAFSYLNPETLKLGRFITSIGEYAFSGDELKEITLSDNLVNIGIAGDKFFLTWNNNSFAHNDGKNYYILNKIIVPETVQSISKQFFKNRVFPDLSEFDVDKNNKFYSSIDGVLYDKSQKSLICFPRNKSVDRFTVPDTVRRIEDGAITQINTENISYFDLGKNVTYIGVDGIRPILEKTHELVLPANLEEFPDEEERRKMDMFTPKFYTKYRRLTIPSYVKKVHPFFIDCESHGHSYFLGDYWPDPGLLNFINVAEDNRFYKSNKGVLYNGDNTELIKCPCSTELKEYKVLYGTKVIDSYAFANTGVETITVPTTVEEIAGSAFKSDYNKVLTVKGYNNSYAENFADEYSYKFVSLGEPVVSGTCSENLEWTLNRETGVLEISGNGEIEDYGSSSGVYQPWETYIDDVSTVIIHEGITSIGSNAFSQHSNLEKVVLPESLTQIGACAFYKCFELSEINITDSITDVEVDAFLNTAWYDSQPDGLLYIGKVAYKYKGQMLGSKKINIKDGTVEIAPYAFVDDLGNSYTSLSSINIPASVTKIGHYAFFNCAGLTEVNMSPNVTEIMSWAFCGCTGLSKIVLPEKITEISDCSFWGCQNLTELIIPDSVSAIGTMALAECRGLRKVVLSDKINKISADAFQTCSRKIVALVSENSYAAKYCEEKGINFSFDNGETIEGYFEGKEYDINLDGAINTIDYVELISIIVEGKNLENYTFFYDVDDDGKIDIKDLVMLKDFMLSN